MRERVWQRRVPQVREQPHELRSRDDKLHAAERVLDPNNHGGRLDRWIRKHDTHPHAVSGLLWIRIWYSDLLCVQDDSNYVLPWATPNFSPHEESVDTEMSCHDLVFIRASTMYAASPSYRPNSL